jgi:beta-lactamase class C
MNRALVMHVAMISALVGTVVPCSPQSGPGDSVRRIVDATIPALMAKDGIPGMAVAVTIGGKPYVFNYGVASLKPRIPVTDETLFEIGSVSKIFTATLASWAQIEHDISLTDGTERYLPELRGTPFGKVTLLSLGTHTPGGLPLQFPDGVTDDNQVMQYFEHWRPEYAMGTYRTYANPGISLLGFIAAKSMGEDFRSLIQRRLFPALGLKNSFIAVPAGEFARYAWGYTDKNAPIRMKVGALSDEAYGVRTTAADMIRFVQENIDPSGLRPAIRQAIVQTHTGYFHAGPMVQDLIWEQYPYPVALSVLQDGNSPDMIFDPTPVRAIRPPQAPQKAVWLNKTGSTNGFSTYVAFVPSERLGIVLLANRSYPIADRVTAAYRILSALAAVVGAPPARPTVVLQRVAVIGANDELGMGIARFPPLSAKPRQMATGPELCYVLKGEVTVKIQGRPPARYHAGQSFALPAYVVHVTVAGPTGAAVLATWVHTPARHSIFRNKRYMEEGTS